MEDKIKEALAQLDVLDDDQWTSDGAPRVDVVEKIVGEVVTRKDIIEANPHFNRKFASEPKELDEDEDEDEDEQFAESVKHLSEVTPMTEKEFAVFIKEVPKEELEDVLSFLRIQQDAVEDDVKKIQDLKNRLVRAVAFTKARIANEIPNMSNQEAIRAYIETQRQLREERMAKRKAILSNISPRDLDPRAPIDSAMARKTGRGGKRPARPLMR